ncbi:alpha/beta fold hydrolase [Flagellimonas allohymeniacidonis]|uniref:Alpha/beta fold hydrolase n=1 Tax=Flagellimonas allohymeniacidonis TaxID=2517819 RepID=A0A4Q8QC36_9FLAO|nr:alpha/beta fold hydrolase [Allomuricauda hymeniacidonis]TAI46977.1 alpha/beta fold hydrolase [Allomuricauda hymeniacidonis]
MELLHSKILGEGEPLLILHGFLGMSDNWKSLGKQYADAGFQVHLIDQRNHGRSFHSPDFDYELMGEDLLFYMDHYQIGEGNLIGHSMGGKTAMQFATSNYERLDKLVVADISPKYYPAHHQPIINALTQLDFESISSRKEADEQLAKHLSDFGIRQFLLKNLHWVETEKLGLRFNLDVLRNKMEEVGDNIDPHATFKGPTLFLRGDRSEYIVPNDFGDIKKHFPQAAIETIENAGHWLHAENPKQFFEKSVDFLNS